MESNNSNNHNDCSKENDNMDNNIYTSCEISFQESSC